METKYPSRALDRIMVRLPDGMRDRLAEAAKSNKRSVNAEVVARLSQSMEDFGGLTAIGLTVFMQRLEASLDASDELVQRLHLELSLQNGVGIEPATGVVAALGKLADETQVNRAAVVRRIVAEWLREHGYLP